MLVFEERGKPEYPEKNLSEQGREPTTNSTHISFLYSLSPLWGQINKDIGAASQAYYSVLDYVCDAGYRIKKNTFYVNPKSDQHQISPCNISAL